MSSAMPSPLVTSQYQALLPSAAAEGGYDFGTLEARVVALEATPTTVNSRDVAVAEATSFTRWWVQECLERLPRFVFPDPLFERVLAAYHARGFREAALRAMLEQYALATRSRASKDALAQVDRLSGELRRVRAQRDAVQDRRDAELLSEAEAREERRVLNGQLDQVQESLDQAEALLGRTGSLREFLPPFTPLTRGPAQVERRPGIDCCAGVRTGLFVPWTWSLRQRREDAGEHGGSVIASG